MPWDVIAPHAPALVALILLVAMAGGLFWKITSLFLRTLSGVATACHTNHREVAVATALAIREASDRAAGAIERNTKALGDCHSCQRETTLAMKEITISLRHANGRGGK